MSLKIRKRNTPVVIRHLAGRPEIIPVIASWIYTEWSFLYAGKTRKYVEHVLQERRHKRKLPITLIALQSGKPVGTVSLKEFDIETRTDLKTWITSLYVVKRLRGRGIGSRLMKAAEEKACKLGLGKLFLFTADRELARHFYGKLGWKTKEKTNYHSYRIIIMEKQTTGTGRHCRIPGQ